MKMRSVFLSPRPMRLLKSGRAWGTQLELPYMSRAYIIKPSTNLTNNFMVFKSSVLGTASGFYKTSERGFAALATPETAENGDAGDVLHTHTPRPMYFDYQATTPLDPRVLDAMMPYMTDRFENPHSNSHAGAWEASAAVEKARTQVASVLGLPKLRSREVVFTSGATESNNMALKGFTSAYLSQYNNSLLSSESFKDEEKDELKYKHKDERKKHIITTQIEHKCVLQCCRLLNLEYEQTYGKSGFYVTFLPVSDKGLINISELKAAITSDTLLVSIMHVNNEIGVVQDLETLGCICKEKKVIFHTDAAQSFGKIPINVDKMNIDLLSISGHKIYGPKGVGALFVRSKKPRIRLKAIIDGGGQERGMRSGTLPTPLVVGLGAAATLGVQEMDRDKQHVTRLANLLLEKLQMGLTDITVNGCMLQRYSGNLNISFEFVEGESLIMSIQDIALSSGSACTSASLEPSYVLRALGVGEEVAHTSLRIGIGRFTRESDVLACADRLIKEVQRLRELSPLYEFKMEAENKSKNGNLDANQKSPSFVWT